MAKFLVTTGVSHHLEQIINGAKERLVLISPYLKVNDRMRALLEDRDRLKLDIRIIYGKNELQPDESRWLQGLRSIKTSFCKNLHAKCYLNESEAIVTSMNLYEFSQVNNHEMGVHLTRVGDADLFKEVLEEAQRLIRTSEEVQISVEKIEREARVPVRVKATEITKPKRNSGSCIRCGSKIAFNPKRPYCADDFEQWTQYKNEDYSDSFCHGCGKKHPSSMRKPLCRDCYARLEVT